MSACLYICFFFSATVLLFFFPLPCLSAALKSATVFPKHLRLTERTVLSSSNSRLSLFNQTARLCLVISFFHLIAFVFFSKTATDGEDQGFAISEPAPNLEPAPTALVPHTRKKGSRKRTNSGGVGGDKQPEMRPGDWICPDISCSNLNFASRLVCGRFRCRITRPGIDPVIARANPNMMPNNGNNAGGQYEFRSGDWVCPKKTCKNHNFASRDVCRMCHEKKPVRRDGDGGEGRGGGAYLFFLQRSIRYK